MVVSLVFPVGLNSGSASDSVRSWVPFPPTGFSWPALRKVFVPSLIISCYSVLSWYPLDPSSFLKGNKGGVDVGERRGGRRIGKNGAKGNWGRDLLKTKQQQKQAKRKDNKYRNVGGGEKLIFVWRSTNWCSHYENHCGGSQKEKLEIDLP